MVGQSTVWYFKVAKVVNAIRSRFAVSIVCKFLVFNATIREKQARMFALDTMLGTCANDVSYIIRELLLKW